MSEKTELLEEVEEVYAPKKPLNFSYLVSVLTVLVLVSIFAFPKIYIQQQIYFKSRNIAKLQSEHDTLKEEKKLITSSIEYIKFKNQILDTLF